MKEWIKDIPFIKKIRKNKVYSRFRQYLPMPEPEYINDCDRMDAAEIIRIDWPEKVIKPVVGIVQDYEECPSWTKYCRFLDNNSFPYDLYNIHAHDWIEKARKFDIVIGIFSSDFFNLIEQREKYHFLETYLNKTCYPSTAHSNLYESKSLEADLSSIYGFPYVKTYISHDKKDALELIKNLHYPVVSKINPSSGSAGVDLVTSLKQSRKIVEQAFSQVGRSTFEIYFRQKDYVYFQDYIPCDGYDIRVITVGNMAFGYFRKALKGDFRASGMNQVEKRELPPEALRIAWDVNRTIKSPILVVDMIHGWDGKYYIIEFSPTCQMVSPEQLHVNDVPGAYLLEPDGTIQFKPGKYWVHELALREFLIHDYLPITNPVPQVTHHSYEENLA